jgi:hypothetical protein
MPSALQLRYLGCARWLTGALALAGLVAGTSVPAAQAASWHLDRSFGSHGVAGLPVREQGIDSPYGPGPGDKGALLAPGPGGLRWRTPPP